MNKLLIKLKDVLKKNNNLDTNDLQYTNVFYKLPCKNDQLFCDTNLVHFIKNSEINFDNVIGDVSNVKKTMYYLVDIKKSIQIGYVTGVNIGGRSDIGTFGFNITKKKDGYVIIFSKPIEMLKGDHKYILKLDSVDSIILQSFEYRNRLYSNYAIPFEISNGTFTKSVWDVCRITMLFHKLNKLLFETEKCIYVDIKHEQALYKSTDEFIIGDMEVVNLTMLIKGRIKEITTSSEFSIDDFPYINEFLYAVNVEYMLGIIDYINSNGKKMHFPLKINTAKTVKSLVNGDIIVKNNFKNVIIGMSKQLFNMEFYNKIANYTNAPIRPYIYHEF